LDRAKGDPLDWGDHHLRDPHSSRDLEGLATQVDQHDHQLAAIIAVDRSRSIEKRDAVTQRQTRPGSDLAFIAFRNGDREPGAKQLPLERCQRAVFGADDVVPSRARSGQTGEWEPLPVGQPGDQDLDQ
jgi:hypothetical protein